MYYTYITKQLALDELYNKTPDITEHKQTIQKDSMLIHNQQDLFMLKELARYNGDRSYRIYHIPKATGGYRTISEPNEDLKARLTQICKTLQRLEATGTEAAHAYEPNRSVMTAIQTHQRANNMWFYKFDLKDFFNHCTTDVLKKTLSNVYPFAMLEATLLDTIINLACYNGALPQGSPLSPLLSNMVMVAFDFHMMYSIKHFNGVYTRYADDILISFKDKHQLEYIEKIITNHLKDYVDPSLKVNPEKSRCGSRNGNNWNLGLMLNKDNNITLGHEQHMKLKSKINNFAYDFTNGNKWSTIEAQELLGILNWFMQIEPNYAAFCMNRIATKYKMKTTIFGALKYIIAKG